MRNQEKKLQTFKTKDECIKEAKRYFANAQTMLKKGKPKNERYQDIKYVRSASGIAYLAATTAIDGLLISKGASPDKLPKNKSGYLDAISRIKQNGKIEAWYKNIHDNIHVLAYYRAMYNQNVIEVSFDEIKRLIEYIDG